MTKRPPSPDWRYDGPLLPIEFARLSKDDRVTLVIVPGRPEVQTQWVPMTVCDVDEARKVLAEREGTPVKNIGYWSPKGSKGQSKDVIIKWAQSHRLDAVVWTDLRPKWDSKD
jgi:hypothetical protein